MTRIVAIMQPTYLPYLGYLDLIWRSDVFVFLDDCQFERKSWQQFNRIPGPDGGERKLVVPVQKQPLQTLIRDIRIDETTPWREAHLEAVRETYAARPHLDAAEALLQAQLSPASGLLSDLNCGLIEAAARRLGWSGEFIRASALGCGGRRSHDLVEILRTLNADVYLSPLGSKGYIDADGVLAEAGLPVAYASYRPIAYDQGWEDFTPYMAFVDALANVGWEGLGRLTEAAATQPYAA